MEQIELNEKIKELQKIIDSSNNIVFFGGAGVSTESGIPDFRSTYGLYNQQWKYPPEQIISHTFFLENPKEFYRFYRAKLLAFGIEPNPAHYKLAELENAGKLKAIVTQNILFICGGAFDGIERKIALRMNTQVVGFDAQQQTQKVDKNDLLQYIAPQDLKSFGLIPEIIGRLPILTYLKPLDKTALRNILTEPKNALTKRRCWFA